MSEDPSEIEALLSLILDWHGATRRLHGPWPDPTGKLRRNKDALKLFVTRNQFVVKRVTEKLAFAAEARGIDTTPYWGVIGNMDQAGLDLWDDAWTVTKRLELKLQIELASVAGDAAQEQERWHRIYKETADSYMCDATIQIRQTAWVGMKSRAPLRSTTR